MDSFHTSVLLREAVEGLRIRRGGLYIDATIGGGGHTGRILDQGGRVLGIDQDEEAILHVKNKFEPQIRSGKLVLVRGNFSDISSAAVSIGCEHVDGILFDLGVSSHQIDDSGRGFAFKKDEPLDMRMNKDASLSAYEVVNTWSAEDLYAIFAKYGEETRAQEIAEAVVAQRGESPIKTTGELASLVATIVPRSGKLHPATRTFQAIRIAVNSELESLKQGLEDGFKLLDEKRRMVVISFHSLEDRIVKLFFLEKQKKGEGRIITKKVIIATNEEVEENKRARSAKMRIIEKI